MTKSSVLYLFNMPPPRYFMLYELVGTCWLIRLSMNLSFASISLCSSCKVWRTLSLVGWAATFGLRFCSSFFEEGDWIPLMPMHLSI